MKIGILAAASMIHTVKWVNSLAELGHEVYLYSLPTHRQSLNKIHPSVVIRYLPFGGPAGYFLNFWSLRKFLSIDKPQILNAHFASGYGTLARLSAFKPCLLSVWGSDVYLFPNQSFLKKWLLRMNLQYADAIGSTSHVMREETSRYLTRSRIIHVTPFGVDTDKFRPIEVKKEPKKIVIGNIKALAPTYGIDSFIEAAALVIEAKKKDESLKEFEFEFRIYGDGPLKSRLIQLSKKLGVEKQVKFMGVIPNEKVPQALSEMDIFCATSENESFGVAVVEAMACGLPVVATKVGGFKEVIHDETCGVLVEPKNPVSISGALLELVRSPEKRLRLASSAIVRVHTHYSWRENVKTMEAVYRDLIASHEAFAGPAAKILHYSTVHPISDARVRSKVYSTVSRKYECTKLVARPSATKERFESFKLETVDFPKNRFFRFFIGNYYLVKDARRFDVVHVHDPELLVGLFLLGIAGKKTVFDAHEDLIDQLDSKDWLPFFAKTMVKKLFPVFLRAINLHLDLVVCATESIASRYGAFGLQTVLVRNFPEKEFSDIDEGFLEKRRPEKLVVYHGGLSIGRGMIEIMAAAKALKDYRFVLAGRALDASDQKLLEDLPNNVEYLGFISRDELKEILKKASVGLVLLRPLKNYIESLPVKMFEYFSFGVPVVASDFNYWEAFVGKSEGLRLVDSFDTEEVQKVIRELVEDKEAQRKASLEAFKAFKESFSWENEGKSLMEAYEHVLHLEAGKLNEAASSRVGNSAGNKSNGTADGTADGTAGVGR